jgi:hypothetical protein
MELEYNSITRPKAQTDSDWKSDATCFADSGQHRRYLEMRSDPYESRLRDLSNKYSWASTTFRNQELWSFEFGAVCNSDSELILGIELDLCAVALRLHLCLYGSSLRFLRIIKSSQ